MKQIKPDCDYAIVSLNKDGEPDKVCLTITWEMAKYCERFSQLSLSHEKEEKMKALMDHLLFSLEE